MLALKIRSGKQSASNGQVNINHPARPPTSSPIDRGLRRRIARGPLAPTLQASPNIISVGGAAVRACRHHRQCHASLTGSAAGPAVRHRAPPPTTAAIDREVAPQETGPLRGRGPTRAYRPDRISQLLPVALSAGEHAVAFARAGMSQALFPGVVRP